MKSILRFAVAVVLMLTGGEIIAQPCSNAGTASSSNDSICPGNSVTLQLTGYVGTIQWQSFTGTVWQIETGTGSTSANYTLSPSQSTDFRAIVTDVGCDPDTSNIISVVVGVQMPVASGDSRCGAGPVTLTAVGSGIQWYNAASGGSPLASGPSFTTSVSSTTTFYAASSLGGAPPNPLQTTFAGGLGSTGNMFDITAINTITIDSFAANLNSGNGTAEIWYRQGSYVGFATNNSGWTLAGSAPYTSPGNGSPGTPINIPVNVTIQAGQTYAFYVYGSGGLTYTQGTAVGNVYVQDANLMLKEGAGGGYFSVTFNPRVFNGIVYYSSGCESARTPVVATVTPAPVVTLSALPSTLCLGSSAQLIANSSNAGYQYSWSPATGLSSTTGANVTAAPTATTVYTVVADDGTCVFSSDITVSVDPISVAGTSSVTTDTICSGDVATLLLSGPVGNVQWQSFNGTSWVNETGPGNNSAQYPVSPAVFSQYRAIVSSGICDPDTSAILSLEVINLSDPVTVNDTICGPGNVNLSASGQGNFNWYTAASGGQSIYNGSTYSPAISSTTTYYVEAMAGGVYEVGPASQSIGPNFNTAGTNFGMQFNVVNQIRLKRIYLAPGGQSGNVIINLRATQNGPILFTKTITVVAFSGLQPVDLDWIINPGNGYRLETGAGSVPLFYNTFGASYPYTFAGSAVSITGYLNPGFNSGNFYYFFYRWEVAQECYSNRVPVTGVVVSLPPVPTISAAGTLLTSSSPVNNQWYLNGSPVSGATGVTYDISLTGPGTYSVLVTDPVTGCTSESLPYLYTGIDDDLQPAALLVYPNPVADILTVILPENTVLPVTYSLYNSKGQKVLEGIIKDSQSHIDLSMAPKGVYVLEATLINRVVRMKLLK